MDVTEIASDLILYALLTAAVIGDLQHMKVSNRLIFTGILSAMVLRFFSGGAIQIIRVLPNMIFPVITLFIFYLVGAVGAGDIKLFSVVGGFLTFHELYLCMIVSFAFAAAGSLALMCRDGSLRQVGWTMQLYLKDLMQGNLHSYDSPVESHRIHFTAAILAGTAAIRLVPVILQYYPQNF